MDVENAIRVLGWDFTFAGRCAHNDRCRCAPRYQELRIPKRHAMCGNVAPIAFPSSTWTRPKRIWSGPQGSLLPSRISTPLLCSSWVQTCIAQCTKILGHRKKTHSPHILQISRKLRWIGLNCWFWWTPHWLPVHHRSNFRHIAFWIEASPTKPVR